MRTRQTSPSSLACFSQAGKHPRIATRRQSSGKAGQNRLKTAAHGTRMHTQGKTGEIEMGQANAEMTEANPNGKAGKMDLLSQRGRFW